MTGCDLREKERKEALSAIARVGLTVTHRDTKDVARSDSFPRDIFWPHTLALRILNPYSRLRLNFYREIDVIMEQLVSEPDSISF